MSTEGQINKRTLKDIGEMEKMYKFARKKKEKKRSKKKNHRNFGSIKEVEGLIFLTYDTGSFQQKNQDTKIMREQKKELRTDTNYVKLEKFQRLTQT
jgi:hypothetical protein